MAERTMLSRIESSTSGREPGRRGRHMSDHAADLARANPVDGLARRGAGRSSSQYRGGRSVYGENVYYMDFAKTAPGSTAPGAGELQRRRWKHYPGATAMRRREGLGRYQRLPAGNYGTARVRNHQLCHAHSGIPERPGSVRCRINCYRLRIAVLNAIGFGALLYTLFEMLGWMI